MYAVISEKRPHDDIHYRSMYYAISPKNGESKETFDQTIEALKDKVNFHGFFDTAEEAQNYISRVCGEAFCSYTRLVAEEGIPEGVKSFTHRYVGVYLGEDLTTSPGVYPIPLYDFLILRETFPQARLATVEELDAYNFPSGPQVPPVPVTPETHMLILTLKTSETVFCSTSETNDLPDDAFISLINCMVTLPTEERAQKFREILPGFPDEHIEALEKMVTDMMTAKSSELDEETKANRLMEIMETFVSTMIDAAPSPCEDEPLTA